MSNPLTNEERYLYKRSAERVVADPDSFEETCAGHARCIGLLGIMETRLRYENSLQAKDAQIAALQAQLEAESDIQYAQRTQIERLTRGLREIMEISNAMGDPFRRAKVIAWKAIKEATT